MNEDRLEFIEAGMDDYLSKPLKFEPLMEMLSKIRNYRAQASTVGSSTGSL